MENQMYRSCITGKVKAQGNCGACYIFSAIDNAAAILAIYYLKFFIEFSAQEIIDCSSNSLKYGWRLLGFEELTTKTSNYSRYNRLSDVVLKSGTFTGCRNNDDVDHAVLLIGYKAGVGWKIKNSWGTRWGEGGYAWISQQNSCRICQNAFYSIPPQRYGASDYQANKILKKCTLQKTQHKLFSIQLSANDYG